MATQWYYARNGQQVGPVEDAQFRQMVASGQILPTELVWREGMATWQAASTVSELAGGVQQVQATPSPYAAGPYAQRPQNLGYATPGGYAASGSPPKTWLTESILCLCCCWPLAIVAIVFAAQVNGKWQAGDAHGANEASAKARQFVMLSFWIGLVIQGVNVAINILGAMAQ